MWYTLGCKSEEGNFYNEEIPHFVRDEKLGA